MNPSKIVYLKKEGELHPVAAIFQKSAGVEVISNTARLQDAPQNKILMIDGHFPQIDAGQKHAIAKQVLQNGQAILLLDPDPEWMTALQSLLGLGIRHIPSAYFIQQETPTHFQIFELLAQDLTAQKQHFDVLADQGELKHHPAAPKTDDILLHSSLESPEVIMPFVLGIMRYAFGDGAQRKPRTDDDIPADIKKWTFTVTSTRGLWINDGGRYQFWSGSFNFHVSLFLNNPVTGEQYQYIHIRQESLINPGNLVSNCNYDRRWFQDRFETSVEINEPGIFLNQSSPKNEAGSVEVTDSVKFNIAYELAKAPKQTGSYEYGHSETRKIQDWQVVENSRLNTGAWTYAQRLPYNAMVNDYLGGIGWVCPPFLLWFVKDLPILSMASLQADTQAVWRTASVMNQKVNCKAKVGGRMVFLTTSAIYMAIYYDVISTPLWEIEFEIDLAKVAN